MVAYTTITKNLKYIELASNLKESLKEKKLYTEYYFPENNSFETLNLCKLKKWHNFILKTEEKSILLIDSDTIIVEDVDHVFSEDFDIAYTANPLNSGVVFVNKNNRSIHFFNKWVEVSEEMIRDKELYYEYTRKYPGFIQTSFGYLIENYKEDINLLRLESSLYNASTKENYDKQEYKILHLRPEIKNLI